MIPTATTRPPRSTGPVAHACRVLLATTVVCATAVLSAPIEWPEPIEWPALVESVPGPRSFRVLGARRPTAIWRLPPSTTKLFTAVDGVSASPDVTTPTTTTLTTTLTTTKETTPTTTKETKRRPVRRKNRKSKRPKYERDRKTTTNVMVAKNEVTVRFEGKTDACPRRVRVTAESNVDSRVVVDLFAAGNASRSAVAVVLASFVATVALCRLVLGRARWWSRTRRRPAPATYTVTSDPATRSSGPARPTRRFQQTLV